MIPATYIEELTQRSPIEELVATYVQLRHRGRTYTGLCPFHNEKTPSFTVYPDTNSFYCFGCGAAGDVIGFVRKMNNLDYVEAVKFLASRAGMPMPDEDDKTGKQRTRILNINKEAARFFYSQLNAQENGVARAYWRGRGLSDATIRKFGLGYAPAGFSSLRDYLRGKGYSYEEMLSAGVIRKSERGTVYDVFRQRVMVPIFDLRGNIVAFGGRNLGDEKPKYLNTPQTLVYNKSAQVYAMNIAKKSKSRRYILCEGYMDVLALHQAGFDTAVAGCGTALTAQQVKLLSEYADEVVLCYDGDEAGQKATQRAVNLFKNTQIKLTVLSLPGAKDADEFIAKNGAEAFEQLLVQAKNSIEYALEKEKAKFDITNEAGRVEYLAAGIEVLAAPLTATQRAVYAGRLAQECDVPRASVEQQLARRVSARARKDEKQKQQALMNGGVAARIKLPTGAHSQTLGVVYAEQQLMAAALKDATVLQTVMQSLEPQHFTTPEMQRIYQAMLALQGEGSPVSLATLSAVLPEEDANLLARILASNVEVQPAQTDITLFIQRVLIGGQTPENVSSGSIDDLNEYLKELKDRKK
ncbi:DNA primase [Ruminococcaceae bacterium OttesenSCG-928-N02]|nr:DNA primase [Ruminococcaceae bacterium OttesenSCG-928-N02]